MREGLRRISVAALLTLKDLLRRRLTLVLLFVVPALFDLVVLATTAARKIDVTFGTLVEDGATIAAPGEPRFADTLLDDGFRTVDQRNLSLVFLTHTAVCFLSCFLAFYLVHRRRDVDGRLVLAGYRPRELLLAKVLALAAIVALLALYETTLLRLVMPLAHTSRVAVGLLAGGFTYGCLGLFLGAVSVHELEGIFLIVLLANVDVGWLQNPVYYSSSQNRGLIESLPGYQSTQLTIVSALTRDDALGSPARTILWALSALLIALVGFGLRIRRPPQQVTARAHDRRTYLKVLVLAYAGWFVSFQLVGRLAATLHTHDLTGALDRWIPVVPAFIWPYELCYALPFLALFVLRDFRRFNRALLAIIIASAAAYVVYLLYPVALPRPHLGTSLSERILAMEYAADFSPGANKLPSLHVALSWIMACAMHGQSGRRAVDAAIWILVAAITVSTVLVKQHVVVDAVAGIAWGLLAYALAGRLYARNVDPDAEPQEGLRQMLRLRPRRVTLALLLVAGVGPARAGEPTDVMQKANAELLDSMEEKAQTAKLHQLLDVRELARRALLDHRREVSPAQEDEIVALLGQLLERSYLAQIRSRAKYRIEYTGESDAGGGDVLVKAVVHTKAKGRETDVAVGYLLHRDGAAYRIVDLITDDVSTLGNYRSQFGKIIGKEGVPSLIARMKRKLASSEAP